MLLSALIVKISEFVKLKKDRKRNAEAYYVGIYNWNTNGIYNSC